MTDDFFLSRYWPSLLGLVVLPLAAYGLWPRSDASTRSETSTRSQPDWSQPRAIEAPPQLLEEQASPTRQSSPASPQGLASRLRVEAARTVLVEKPIPVTFKTRKPRTLHQEDEDVQRALKQVSIIIYAADDLDVVNARSFLGDNGLAFEERSLEAPMMREKLRRVAGITDTTTMVVDGRPVIGFSKQELESALSRAVEQRIQTEDSQE